MSQEHDTEGATGGRRQPAGLNLIRKFPIYDFSDA